MGEHHRTPSARELKLIEQVRKATRKLPGVDVGIDGFGHTTFKVGKKSFVLVGAGHGDEGSMSIKADPTTQASLVKRGPYVRTPYIGQHGWVSVFGDADIDWSEVTELIEDAYRLAAPKKLLKQLDES
jgi:predicted DNA-binding protein (MmcQ/YjbR family)